MSIGAFGENFPYSNFHDLNMDWIIKTIKDFNDKYPEVMEDIINKLPYPTNDRYGNPGDYLISNGDGTTSWFDVTPIWTETIYEAVNQWLAEHPEATTTVQDNSLTAEKFTEALRQKTIKDYGTPEMYGAVGDGIEDDTNAFQTALTNHGTVILTGKYKLSDTVNVPSKRSVLFFGNSQIIADIPSDTSLPLFMLDTVSNVEFCGFGGAEPNIRGTCAIAFYMKGQNNFEISPANYTKFVKFKDLWISDNTGIGIAIYMETAVRQVTIDDCTIYCNNGIFGHGKTVENVITNSIIWATSTGGYAIKLDSHLEGSKYHEGWTISNCTIDCSDKSTGSAIEVSDFWVIQLVNSYVGAKIHLKEPTTTTHSEDFLISNCVVYNNIETTGTASFYLKVDNTTIINGKVYLRNNARYVTIANLTMKNSSSDEVAIVLSPGVSHVLMHDIRIDSSYHDGIVINGNAGTDITIHDYYYEGNGNYLYTARPIYRHHNHEINYTKTAITQGTKAVNSTIGSCTRSMVEGTNFLVNVKTTLKGGVTSGSGQILSLDVSNGTGQIYIPFYGGTQLISLTKVMTCTTTGQVTVTLKNYQGNSVTTDYHDYIEIVEL